MNEWHQTLKTISRLRGILYLVAVTYALFSLLGYVLIYSRVPSVVAYHQHTRETLLADPIISSIIRAIETGNLVYAITFTFLWNFLVAAFATMTLPGIIPLAGASVPLLLSAVHGFDNGLILYYAFGVSVPYSIAAVGTAILELSAYVFASTAGINISLSTAFPGRQRVKSRRLAFKRACRDAERLYIIVTILLALAAVWEIVGIYVTRVMA